MNISLDDIRVPFLAGTCQVTGLPFDFSSSYGPFVPSVDRIDSNKGYTKDNIQIVCWVYNAAKQHWCHEDVMKMAKALCAGKYQS